MRAGEFLKRVGEWATAHPQESMFILGLMAGFIIGVIV